MSGRGFAAVLAGLLGTIAWADEPAKPEKAPAPKPVVEVPPAFCRPNRYAVWQYYDVDRQGRFRPLVINSPYGAYYLYNGEPYYWVPIYPRDVLMKVAD